MNKKILGIFFLIIFLVVGVPFLAVIKNIIVLQMAMSSEDTTPAGPKPPPAPPLLNESNLVGTAWVVKHPQIPVAVTITLNSGGQALATVPPEFSALAIQMIGTDRLAGTWSVNGAKLIASVDFKGQKHTVECDIIGDKIYYQDREIQRAK